MANTVNDVMNVIANSDYGIKNIAGTTQEILAILSGTHNSQNNIHSVVNDVKNLLQHLVISTTEKKPVEVATNSAKINQKHIQNILDETKGIRKAIMNLEKSFIKQGGKEPSVGVAKLSDKASDKVAEAMVKNISKQNTGGGLSTLVDSFNKLKDISLKDIIIGNQKVKQLMKAFKNAQKDLKVDEKEFNSVIKLINAAPEMIKSLHKINRKINSIIKNDVIKKLSDILIGENSILKISIELEKNKKSFDSGTKVATTISELASTLSKTMWNILLTSSLASLANNGIKNVESTISKLIPLTDMLVKNKKSIDDGTNASKNINELASALNKAMWKLLFASLVAKIASNGVKSIDSAINKLMPLSRKLAKNKKDIDRGTKAAKKLTILVGNLLITSIFLTVAAVTGILAVVGAKLLNKMVSKIIPVAKKLSRNGKHIAKALPAALALIAFTGLMAISSAFLATIAVTGAPAILGSIFMVGIIAINIFAFKMLGKSLKTIAKGAISMLIMSLSLMLFGAALKKIVDATKGVTFKQVGIIAAMTVILGGTIAILGIPAVFPFILLGSISIAIMGLALLPFAKSLSELSKATKKLKMKQVLLVTGSILTLGIGVALAGALVVPIVLGSVALGLLTLALKPFIKTLSKISKATKNLKMKNLLLVNGAMMTLGLGVAAMSVLTIPITLGSAALGAMGLTLYRFVKTLKMINDMGDIPKKQVDEVLTTMKAVGTFFTKNALKRKAVRSARRYKQLMRPFRSTLKHLNKLKELGSVPMKLVFQTLMAMSVIASHYKMNPIKRKVIKQAKRYKKMLRPFGNTLKHLAKLKELGTIPMKLIFQVLGAMSTIANYYVANPIKKKVIKQAKRYKKMLRPFGNTLKHLAKLKELGVIPMKLVFQTLMAMSTIANYYVANPIKRKVIKQARRYKKMLRPFGNTIKHLAKLKELGVIPMKLVNQTLKAMSKIANYYVNNPIKRKVIKQARRYKKMLQPFGNTIKHLTKLKELGLIPSRLVEQTLITMTNIADFYKTITISENTEEKSKFIESVVNKFTNVAVNIQNKFKNLKSVDVSSVLSIVMACSFITNFYSKSKFSATKKKIKLMNKAVRMFAFTLDLIKDKLQGFTKSHYSVAKLAVKSFKKIIKYYVNTKFSIPMEKVSLMNESVKLFVENVNYFKNNIQSYTKEDGKIVKLAIKSFKKIIKYYTRTKFSADMEKVSLMNESVKLFADSVEYVKNKTQNFTESNCENITFAVKSMKHILKVLKSHSLNDRQIQKANDSLVVLNDMASTMSTISKIDSTNITAIGDGMSKTLSEVNTIDISKVKAVTNMLNSFNGINKSKTVVDKFTESVKEFTSSCKKLMNAMKDNTDAINNMDTSSDNNNEGGYVWDSIRNITNNTKTNTTQTNSTSSIRIANVEELARTIAEKINGTLSVDVPDTQVQLLINGSGGNEWTISRY